MTPAQEKAAQEKTRRNRIRYQLYATAARCLNGLFRERGMKYVAAVGRARELVVVTGGGHVVFKSTIRSKYAREICLEFKPIEYTEIGLIRAFNHLFYGTLDVIADYETRNYGAANQYGDDAPEVKKAG